jgi:hypothetical protein
MKKIDRSEAQHDIDELKKERKLRRKPRSLNHKILMPHTGQILAWAESTGGSRRYVRDLIKRKLNIHVSDSVVYRFVIKINGGSWTHPSAQIKQKTKA